MKKKSNTKGWQFIYLTVAVAQVYRGEKWGQKERRFSHPVVSNLYYHTVTATSTHCHKSRGLEQENPVLGTAQEETGLPQMPFRRQQMKGDRPLIARTWWAGRRDCSPGAQAAQHLSVFWERHLSKDPKTLNNGIIEWIFSTSQMGRQSQQKYSLNKHTFYRERWQLL